MAGTRSAAREAPAPAERVTHRLDRRMIYQRAMARCQAGEQEGGKLDERLLEHTVDRLRGTDVIHHEIGEACCSVHDGFGLAIPAFLPARPDKTRPRICRVAKAAVTIPSPRL